ncbi:MAG: PDZ domain-containing protein [Candidatus Korobacteraceae bacterium]
MQPSSNASYRSNRLFSLNILVLICLASLLSFGQATETLPLYEAMREGKVVANFRATGASSGDSIEVDVSKGPLARPGSLQLTVPAGLKLLNGNWTWQSMVVSGVSGRLLGGGRYVPTSTITLSNSMPSATYVLSAYCAEFQKDNPSPSSMFTVQPPDSITACILANSARQGLSVQATQAAVWIYTDQVDYGTMAHKFPVPESDWQAASSVANTCMSTTRSFQPFTGSGSPLTGNGSVAQATIGIQFNAVRNPAIDRVYGATQGGVVIAYVEPSGPSERAGLKTGDVVIDIGGAQIKTNNDLVAQVRLLKSGVPVRIRYLRDGKEAETVVVPVERERVYPQSLQFKGSTGRAVGIADLGIKVGPLGAQQGGGVTVLEVIRNSFAESIGLSPGDTIIELNKVRVNTGEQFRNQVGGPAWGNDVVLLVRLRNDQQTLFMGGTLPVAPAPNSGTTITTLGSLLSRNPRLRADIPTSSFY